MFKANFLCEPERFQILGSKKVWKKEKKNRPVDKTMPSMGLNIGWCVGNLQKYLRKTEKNLKSDKEKVMPLFPICLKTMYSVSLTFLHVPLVLLLIIAEFCLSPDLPSSIMQAIFRFCLSHTLPGFHPPLPATSGNNFLFKSLGYLPSMWLTMCVCACINIYIY